MYGRMMRRQCKYRGQLPKNATKVYICNFTKYCWFVFFWWPKLSGEQYLDSHRTHTAPRGSRCGARCSKIENPVLSAHFIVPVFIGILTTIFMDEFFMQIFVELFNLPLFKKSFCFFSWSCLSNLYSGNLFKRATPSSNLLTFLNLVMARKNFFLFAMFFSLIKGNFSVKKDGRLSLPFFFQNNSFICIIVL